jgi:hypothetical protein
MFRQVGFGKVRALIGFRGKFVSIPTLPIGALEYVLERLPVNFTRQLARGVLRPFLGINLVGTK